MKILVFGLFHYYYFFCWMFSLSSISVVVCGTANSNNNNSINNNHNNTHKKRPVAIITGGTRGIGSGIAEALADAGFDLLLTYNSNTDAANAFVDMLQSKHSSSSSSSSSSSMIQCELVKGDVSKPQTRDAIFDCFDTKFRHNHILRATIHNAGQYVGVTSTNDDGLEASNIAFGDNQMLGPDGKPNFQHVHYYQALYGDAFIDLCERSLARMNHQDDDGSNANNGGGSGGGGGGCGGVGGSLIGISSPGCNLSYGVNKGYSLPGSGKCIMEYSMRIIAMTAAAKNVNCNVIVPGVTLSDAWHKVAEQRGLTGEDITQRVVNARVPMKRPLDVRGIGDVAAFLCSEKGRYITGVSLPVDGGLHLN